MAGIHVFYRTAFSDDLAYKSDGPETPQYYVPGALKHLVNGQRGRLLDSVRAGGHEATERTALAVV